MTIANKKRDLEGVIAGCGSMLVSFSGGVDSTLLAVLARDVLGDRSRFVFLDSPLVSRASVTEAKKIAKDLGIMLDIVEVPHMEHEPIRNNPPDRCYHLSLIHISEPTRPY